MKDFPIPVVGVGFQPDEGEELQYLPMPDAMMTFSMPTSGLEADPEVLAGACAIVELLREQMRAAPIGSVRMPVIELINQDADVVRLLNQTMGEGEVSIAMRGSVQYRIQETVFAGVWRVREYAADGRLISDAIMACAIPPLVRELALGAASLQCAIPSGAAGLMNAPAVLTEIAGKAASHKTGAAAHIINLTLLPMSPEDMACMIQTLGAGAVTILSRGYGNCRISSTQIANVWWVQYFNSMDTLILNTIEVCDMPEVALASKEDYEDSIERLGEWLQVMQAPEGVAA